MNLEISPEQCRAARQLLNWTAQDLEANSGISARTISLFETAKRGLRPSNMQSIIEALDDAGIEFLQEARGKGEGVRLKQPRQPPE
jgi:transcriptional regulator with XRE-family HTH domain